MASTRHARRSRKGAAAKSRGGGHRPIWNGHLVFGLVSVPVRVFAALDAAEHVGFRLLHRKDRAPITYKKFCSREDVEVPNDEIVRGYESSKGKYKLVEKEELQEVQEELGEGQHSIDLMQFVEPKSLDPLLFERPYFLVPDEGGEKAYALLRDAIRESNRVGVARLYLRRPVLAAILPHEDVLALEVMRPYDELRAAAKFDVPAARTSEPEKRMAQKLIDEMTAEWDPRAHGNRYRATLEKLLEGRAPFTLEEAAAGEEGEKAEGKVVDLMDALRRSLGEGGKRQRAVGARSAGRRTASQRSRARPRSRARKASGTRAH
jgi:DNA end-binding protein Ku